MVRVAKQLHDFFLFTASIHNSFSAMVHLFLSPSLRKCTNQNGGSGDMSEGNRFVAVLHHQTDIFKDILM